MAGYRDLLTERYRGLLTGEKKPWELPEFKGMEYTLAKRGALARKGTGRQMRVAGIRGPAVGLTLRGMEEAEAAPLGDVMKTTYGALPGKAAKWAASERGMDIEEKLGLGALRETRKARKFAEKQAKFQSQTTMAGEPSSNCVLTTACYGEDSVEVAIARSCRDATKFHPVVQRIIRGYYIFSDLLLPLMEFDFIKSMVKHALIDPLIFALLRYEGLRFKSYRIGFDSPVAYVALSLWKIMGSRKPYRRRNGEMV